MEEDYKHPKMIHSTGAFMQLDVYIEALRLAVEYQGIQHYQPIYFTGRDFEVQRAIDAEKRQACEQVLFTVDVNNIGERNYFGRDSILVG